MMILSFVDIYVQRRHIVEQYNWRSGIQSLYDRPMVDSLQLPVSHQFDEFNFVNNFHLVDEATKLMHFRW